MSDKNNRAAAKILADAIKSQNEILSAPPKPVSFDTRRQHVWAQAWCAVAQANDCKTGHVATTWADTCLAAFDERFGGL